MDLKEVENVNPWRHWYYLSKASAVRNILVPNLSSVDKFVDVGAGSAFFSEFLSSVFPKADFYCVDTNYVQEIEVLTPRITLLRQSSGIKADVLLFMDVLEHVEDDLELLNEYVLHANVGAKVLITVPAYMSLWSEHDVFLGHYRRYRRNEVNNLVTLAGLEIEESRYLFSSLFPLVYFLRKFGYRRGKGSNMSTLPCPINWLLLQIHNVEHRFFINKLFGLSVVVLARKVS